jgi:hypothetical protein
MINKKPKIMKATVQHIIFSSIAFIAFSFLSPAMATGNLEVNTLENEKTVRMALNTPAEGEISLVLFDQYDRIYFNDRISAGTTFEEEFDFSTVRRGTYKLVSEMGNMRYNRVFKVGKDAVEFQESYFSTVPQFRLEGDMLLVHLIKDANEDVGISIEDAYGQVFDAYYEDPGNTFSKVFGLDDLESGFYEIRLMYGSELFSHEFTLE